MQGQSFCRDCSINQNTFKTKFPDAIIYIEKLESIAYEYDMSLPELSLCWIYKMKEISKILIGVENISQLSEHLNILNSKIDDDVTERILSVIYNNENTLNPSNW